jgi:hypothetical protein
MRFAALALPLLLVTAILTFSPRVSAQASDADRAAARELFNKGVELQNQQKFTEALDHFERSQKVVNAPTIYLHVGQCQAALGRLVEATEAFRQAVNFQLPANPPAPFVAAQNEATTQLAAISPRIPELKITVQPKDIPTLTVTVDDQPVNAALVGISRPTNPGTHKVTASAPGYSKAERTIDLKEKQKLEVTLSLVSTGGVVYGPTGSDTGVTVQPAGSASAAASTSAAPPSPPPPPPRDPRSKLGIFLGLRLGFSAMAGSLPLGDAAQDTESIGDVAGPGGQIGIEAAFRFVRILYISLTGDIAGYSGKDNAAATTSMTSGMVAGHFGILTNPDGLAFFGDLGAGYRFVDLKGTPSNGTAATDATFNGEDFILRLGIHFKAGKYVRIIPQTEMDFGSLGTNSPVPTNTTAITGDTSASQSAGHVAFFFGVGGYFDIDLDKPKPAAASTPTPASPSPPAAAPASTDASGSAGVTLSPAK